MALSFGKRAWNTLWLPVRIWWTALYGWLDAVNTVANIPKQAFEIISNTTGQIKDVFSNARNTWKRYNKLVNVPLSPFIATGTAIEWAVRAVVNPSWNAITHTRDVAWNILVNTWNSVKWTLGDKPISDFKYEHLKTNPIGTKNYVSKWQWFSKWDKKTESKSEEKKDEVVTKKDDKKPEDSKWPSEKEIALEKKVLSMEDMMKKLFEQQEKTNEQLKAILSAQKNEWKIVEWNLKKGNQTNQNPNPKNKWKKITMNNNRKNIENDENSDENSDESQRLKQA